MKCSNCGNNIPDESMFCMKCGSKINNSGNNKERFKSFPLCGYNVSYDSDLITFNDIRSEFVDFAKKSKQEYIEYYKSNIHSFEKLYSDGLQKFIEYINEAVRFGVFVLMEHGIDYIDEEAFIEYMDDDELRVEHVLNMFIGYADDIQNAVDEISEYRQAQRSSRGHWQGGGFGLSGAIKGALTAGAMNIATNAVRGIGDSFVNSSDRNKIEKLKDRIVNGKENIFILSSTIYSAYLTVFTNVYSILINKDEMPGFDFDTEILERKINNYMSMYKSGKDVYQKLMELLIEAIEIYPYNAEFFADIYEIAKHDRCTIYPLAEYFGIDNELSLLIEKFDEERISKVNSEISNDNIKSINMKIEALKQIEAENPTVNISNSIKKLQEKKRYL